MNRRLAEILSLDRLAARLPAGLRFALCLVLLGGLLALMIGHRALILRDGTEVRLAIVPVDPRDLFRGDGRAAAVAAHRTRPADPAAVVIQGRVSYVSTSPRRADGREACGSGAGCPVVGVEYGIEAYFVPEGEGRAIETTEKSRLEIVAAVARSGDAAIKRLLLDGKMLYTEPLY
jgi:hypothetical protein